MNRAQSKSPNASSTHANAETCTPRNLPRCAVFACSWLFDLTTLSWHCHPVHDSRSVTARFPRNRHAARERLDIDHPRQPRAADAHRAALPRVIGPALSSGPPIGSKISRGRARAEVRRDDPRIAEATLAEVRRKAPARRRRACMPRWPSHPPCSPARPRACTTNSRYQRRSPASPGNATASDLRERHVRDHRPQARPAPSESPVSPIAGITACRRCRESRSPPAVPSACAPGREMRASRNGDVRRSWFIRVLLARFLHRHRRHLRHLHADARVQLRLDLRQPVVHLRELLDDLLRCSVALNGDLPRGARPRPGTHQRTSCPPRSLRSGRARRHQLAKLALVHRRVLRRSCRSFRGRRTCPTRTPGVSTLRLHGDSPHRSEPVAATSLHELSRQRLVFCVKARGPDIALVSS